jgi:glycine cleavage system H protein
MSNIPEDLHYSGTHEWVRLEGDTATLGVTDHAQESMGDMVYVDLPEVGKKIGAKGECGVLESVKSASDIYSPVAGEITAVNEKLTDTPDLVNKDPYGEGWLVRLRLENVDAVKELMDAAAYKKFLEEAE